MDSILVQWHCGCIGFPPEISEPATGKSLIIKPCDTDSHDAAEYYLFWRDMGGKDYEPVPTGDALDHIARISAVMHEGYKLREIRRLLK